MDKQKEDRIRQRAYQLWEDDGSPEGRADDYWGRAEAQVNAEGDEAPPEPTAEQSDKRRVAGVPLQEDGNDIPAAEGERERRRGGRARR